MQIELGRDRLERLVVKQLNAIYLDLTAPERDVMGRSFGPALDRTESCFAASKNKYYRRENAVYFNPYHTGQYCIFLYYLANQLFVETGSNSVSDRLYGLNKALHGLDLYYEVDMPPVFFLDHPVGSVMGRAVYGSGFRFAQNCTVGNNKGVFPVIGERVSMMSGATIIGRCRIGDDAILSARTFVKDEDVPPASLVFGSSPALVFKPRRDLDGAA